MFNMGPSDLAGFNQQKSMTCRICQEYQDAAVAGASSVTFPNLGSGAQLGLGWCNYPLVTVCEAMAHLWMIYGCIS